MILSAESAEAIEKQRIKELRALTDEAALVSIDSLLSMAVEAYFPPEKIQSLGLIERQRILYGLE